MTELGEGAAVSIDPADEALEDHWVQVEYTYSNGQPVEGSYYATDGSGMDWTGQLNDKGQMCLAGLPPGNVKVELIPSDDEETLKRLRQSIKQALDEIIQAEKQEATSTQLEYLQYGPHGHKVAIAKGLWDGAVGLVSFVWDVAKTAAEVAAYLNPAERLSNLLNATYKSYQAGELTEAEWRESLLRNYQDEEFKDLAELLGFDVRTLNREKIKQIKLLITEAYEVTAFILDDGESNKLLTQFARDYAAAQSSYEWAEFAGGGVFEIVLTALLLAFTAGIGNVAQGVSKIRHAAKLKNLGTLFRRLGKLLKRRKLNRKVSAGIDSRKKALVELPDEIKLKTRPESKKKPTTKTDRKPRQPSKDNPKIDHSKTTKNADGSTTYYDKKGNKVTYNKDGYPDFSEYSEIDFTVDNMDGTNKDFSKVYKKMKDDFGFKSQKEAQEWLAKEGLTPHHHINGKTIQLVDKTIHDTFQHTGGASILRGK